MTSIFASNSIFNFSRDEDRKVILWLKLAAIFIFLGRAYQYLFWNAPFRVILWDEDIMIPIVEGFFNTTWNDYATNLNVDLWIERSIHLNGWIYVLAALSCICINSKNGKWFKPVIGLGSILLFVLALLEMKDKFFHYAQFFEHSIQIGVPLLLIYFIQYPSVKKLILALKILIALTFTSHGLYALGYYPIPGYFIDMCISILPMHEDMAINFLNTVGVLDILLSILIFIPFTSKWALLYALLWGFATALARIITPIEMDSILQLLHQYGYAFIFRLPHAIIPLMVYLMSLKNHTITTPTIASLKN